MGNTIVIGRLGGRFGYLRFGDGPRPLVLMPGLYLDGDAPGGLAARAYAYGFRALTAAHALVVWGARIAEPGRRLCAERLRLAAAQDWRGVRASLATAVVDGRLARRLVRTLVRRSDPPPGPSTKARQW
jgi:hypothetical protein